MSRCAYCRHELPGLESLCDECFLAGYDRVVHPEPWWHGLRPRFERRNFIGFGVLSAFCLLVFHFDFPYFRTRLMMSTENAAGIAVLVGCVAFFRDLNDKPGVETPNLRIDWGKFWQLAAVELAAGVALYGLFTITPRIVEGFFIVVSWVVSLLARFDPERKKNSLGSRLRLVTIVPALACLIGWRITEGEVWLRLMLVGFTLIAGLHLLDWREDWE